MQFIPKKWYIIYNWVLVSISGLFVIAYILSKVIPPLHSFGVGYNLTLYGSIFAFLSMIFGIVGFKLISKSVGNWLAAIITTMLFDLFVITQLSNTSSPHIFIYTFIWWCLAAYSGAFGLIVVLACDLIAVIIGVLKGAPNLSSLPLDFQILIIGTIIFSVVPYLFFWKKKLQDNKSNSKVSEIEGMPDDTQKQNETLVESIADGVIVIDKTAKISLINPTASQMTEWDSIDAIGVDVNLVVGLTTENGEPYTEQTNPFSIVLSTNTKLETTSLMTGHKGKKMIVSLVVSPVIIERNTVALVGVMRDITQQKAAEKQRADFISTASHEMRTPVAAIEGYLSLAMNDKVSSIDTRARNYLEKAHQSTRQLGKLFQDLLTSSRADDGRLVNHPLVIEMNEFIQKLAESFQIAAQHKRLIVDFVLIGENGMPDQITGKVIAPLYYVHVDPERISEVITNVFDNAVKYTQAGNITVGLGGDAQNVQIFIQDTGAGIPPEDVPHLFQKFYRVDNSAVRTIGGTGLGLYICKKIVELYGGQIWVESVLGKGSTFRINLPRISSQQADALKRTETLRDEIAMPQSNVTL